MPQMLPTAISDAFRDRGWARGAGGDLYYNGQRNTLHPHLHLRLGGPRPGVGGDIRLAVGMLAWSVGVPGQGMTFIGSNGDWVRPNWSHDCNPLPMNPATREEFAWIMSYFVYG